MQLGEPDEKGRRRPVPIDGAFTEIPCDTVIMAIGQALVDDFAKDLDGLTIERDQVEIDPLTLATGRDGVFAGGDVAALGPLTAIEAVAAGRRAAAAIHNYLRGEKLVTLWEDSLPVAEPDPDVVAKVALEGRVPMPVHNGAKRRTNWDEVRKGFTEEQAVREASRCLDCAICSECMECVRACGPGALCHDERDKEYEVEVGAVVLATGYDAARPRCQERVRLQTLPQRALRPGVRAAAQRQRPDHGRGQARQRRPAPQEDRLHPVRRLARPGARLLLQRLLHVRQQAGDAHHRPRCRTAEPEIFLMDMRAQGKGFDAFYQRALAERRELHPLAALVRSRKTR